MIQHVHLQQSPTKHLLLRNITQKRKCHSSGHKAQYTDEGSFSTKTLQCPVSGAWKQSSIFIAQNYKVYLNLFPHHLFAFYPAPA